MKSVSASGEAIRYRSPTVIGCTRGRSGLIGGFLALVMVRSCLGFAHAQIGDPIEQVEMRGLDGERHALLSDAKVNFFVFLDPSKAHSQAAMLEIAMLKERMADAPVHWVAVVSDHCPREEAREQALEAEFRIPILIDEADSLYGKLGVALHPVIGITDKDHILRHYLPFRKVNYAVIIEGAIRQVLGEISEEEFAEKSDPSLGKGRALVNPRAGARMNFARRLLAAGRPDDALAQVRIHLEAAPDDVDGLVLLAKIHSSLGDKESALKAAKRAAELEPEDLDAVELQQKLEKN